MKECVFMSTQYNINLKKKLCTDICINGKSTIKTAEEYNVPLKTLENWITSFNKDNHCFDYVKESNGFKFLDSHSIDLSYDNLSIEDLKKQLMKKDIL